MAKDAEVTDVRTARSGALVIETKKPMDQATKQRVQEAVNRLAFKGANATKALVRPTHSLLKFDFIPLRFDDGSEMSDSDLSACVRAHPQWANTLFVEPIKRIPNARTPGVATLLCKVADDDKGSKAKALLKTLVRFGSEVRRCREWFNKPPTRQCSICQKWGHHAYVCRSRSPWCAVCAQPHPTSAHHYSCKSEGCAGKCQCDIERCINCNGGHTADSNYCPFWLARNNPAKMTELLEKKKKERPPLVSSTASRAKGKKPAVFVDDPMDDDPTPSQ